MCVCGDKLICWAESLKNSAPRRPQEMDTVFAASERQSGYTIKAVSPGRTWCKSNCLSLTTLLSVSETWAEWEK